MKNHVAIKVFTCLLLLIFCASLSTLLFPPVQADSNTNTALATYVFMEEKTIEPGAIIVFANKKYRLSVKPYDTEIVGVYTDKPAVGVNYQKDTQNKALLSSGIVLTRVSTENGQIEADDLITSSSVKGVGMKSSRKDVVLGKALGAYHSKDKRSYGLIPVLISNSEKTATTTAKSSIYSIFSQSTTELQESPGTVFKYLVAAVVVIISVALTFLTFSRIASNGISALGRNPMARGDINVAILINVLISFIIVGSGVFVAYLILLL